MSKNKIAKRKRWPKKYEDKKAQNNNKMFFYFKLSEMTLTSMR